MQHNSTGPFTPVILVFQETEKLQSIGVFC